jgi:hypothetical protein
MVITDINASRECTRHLKVPFFLELAHCYCIIVTLQHVVETKMLILAVIGGLFLFCVVAGVVMAFIDIKIESVSNYKKHEEKDNTIWMAPRILGSAR